MTFLPWENVEYSTKLTKDEIINRINNVVEPKGVFWIFKKYSYGKPYDGEIYENGFKISRIIFYRNPFSPIIEGNIFENEERRTISIKMRCIKFVIGFMSIWFGVVLFLLLITIITAKSVINIMPSIIGILIIIFLGYIIMIGAFKFESIKSKKFFNELFCEIK
jgi:hypothetical protein